jgi:hypothetical protein
MPPIGRGVFSMRADDYRAQLIRHLQNRNAERAKLVADLQEENERDSAVMARVSAPLPEENLCMQCWYVHGAKSTMSAMAARLDDPPGTERLECLACGLGWAVPQ